MSATIDERVVEMRFDNKQFEAETKKSMGTLDRLKTYLKGLDSVKAFDGLGKVSKNMRLKGIESSLAALEKRFSTLGIVGMTVIQNLTNGFMNKLGSAVNFVKDRIISGGLQRAMNLENAHFSLQALLKDEVKVQQIMDDANAAVDGTAYAFDEAAKAASMFAASGIQGGEDMQNALKGIVGTAAMTNSEFEGISMIFTSVAGQGRLMGDQLLQLSSRGLNAAATIADYMNNVQDGTAQASDEVKNLISELTNGTRATEGLVRESVTDGAISFKLFAEAMNSAFGESAAKANETFNGAFSNLKSAFARIGQGFYSPLIEQNSELILLINVLRERVNEVKKALVFDSNLGNYMALSNVFTTITLSLAKYLKEQIKVADFSKTFEIAGKSATAFAKGIGLVTSYLYPLADALVRTFFSFDEDDVINFLNSVIDAFDRMKPSKKVLDNLYDGSKGIASVLKLIVTIGGNLLGIIVPVNRETSNLGEGVASLFGAFGRLLTRITDVIEGSGVLNYAFAGLGTMVRKVVGFASKCGAAFGKFLDKLNTSPQVARFVKALFGALEGGFEIVQPYASDFIDLLKKIGDAFKTLVPDAIGRALDWLSEKFEKLIGIFEDFGDSKASENIEKITDNVSDLVEQTQDGTKKASVFLSVISGFGRGSAAANANLSGIVGSIKEMAQIVGGGISTAIEELFGNLSLGGILSAGSAVALVKSINKLSDSFSNIGKAITDIPKGVVGVLKELCNTLKMYQKGIKANILKEVAKSLVLFASAIFVISGAIALLSNIDPARLLSAALAITAVGAVLIGAFAVIQNIGNKASVVEGILDNLASGIKKKLIASALKDLALSLGVLVASIAGVWAMYRTDASSLDAAVKLIGKISLTILGVYTAISLIGTVLHRGGSTMAKIGISMVSLAMSLGIIIGALKKLFKMEFPSDADKKIDTLKRIMVWIGVLSLVGAASGRIGGGKFNASGILGMAASLMLIVQALQQIIDMRLPNEKVMTRKMHILEALIGGLAVMVLAVGYAGKMAGGGLKATGTLVSLAVLLMTLLGALFLLTKMDLPRIYAAVGALGLIFVALGIAFKGVGKVQNKSAGAAVLGMAALIVAITGSIGILTMIPFDKALKSAVVLGAVLAALSLSFSQAAKMNDKNIQGNLTRMIAIISVLSGALFLLALHDFSKLLAAGTALSAVIVSFGACMKLMSTSTGDLPSIQQYLANIGVLVTIATAIGVLAFQPWDSLLAAGGALSLTLVAFSGAMAIASKANFEKGQIVNFVAGTLALIPMAAAIGIMAFQPWNSLLAAGTALSEVILAFTVCFGIISKSGKINPGVIGSFIVACVGVAGIGLTLGWMAGKDWQGLKAAGESLSEVLLALAVSLKIVTSIHTTLKGALKSIAALDLFIANMAIVMGTLGALMNLPGIDTLMHGGASMLGMIGDGIGAFVGGIVGGITEGIFSSLPSIGTSLSSFMDNLSGFITGISNIPDGAGEKAKLLASAIMALAAADIFEAIARFINQGESALPSFATDLSIFMVKLTPFLMGLNMVSPDAMKAAKLLAQVIAAFTATDLLNRMTSWIGKKTTMSEFAEELVPFGRKLVVFADIVKDVKADSVKGAAAAGEIMAQLANKLPAAGGWYDKVFGASATLSEFGEELVEFGPSIVEFANTVNGVKKSSVSGAAAAAEIMANLADTLPTTGGFVDKIFGSQKSLSDFGEELASFGTKFREFYESVKGVKSLSKTVAALEDILGLADKAYGVDFSGLSALGNNLVQLAEQGLDDFLDVFGNSSGDVVAAIEKMLSVVALRLRGSKSVDFTAAGKKSAETYLKGLNNSINKGFTAVKIKMIANGSYLVAGLVQGINQNAYKVDKAMSSLATRADKALRVKAGIKSPSDMTEEDGKFLAEGVAVGVKKSTGDAEDAMWFLGDAVLDVADDALKGKGFGDKVMDFVSGGWNAAKDGITNLVNQVKDAGTDAGKSLDQSVATGITKSTASEKAVTTKTKKVTKKTKKETKKAAYNIQEFMHITLAEIQNNTNRTLADVVADMSKRTLSATEKIMLSSYKSQKKIYDYLNTDLADTATVTSQNISTRANEIVAIVAEKSALITRELENQQKQREKQQAVIDKRQEEYDQAKQAYEQKRDENRKEKTAKQLKLEMQQAKTRLDNAKAEQKGLEAVQKAGMTAEDKYWEKLLKTKQKGAEYAQYQDMTYIEFEKHILETASSLLKEYTDQLDSTAENILNSIDIFTAASDTYMDEVLAKQQEFQNAFSIFDAIPDEGEDNIISGQELIYRAQERANLAARYVEVYAKAQTRLAGTALWDAVKTLGVESTAQLEELMRMSDADLKKLCDTYQIEMENNLVAANMVANETIEKISKEALQANIESRVQERKDYNESIATLTKRLGDGALADYLIGLGIEAKDEIDALNTMTDEELKKYVASFEELTKESEKQAKLEVTGLAKTVEGELQKLFGTPKEIKLFDFSKAFDGTMKSINKYLKQIEKGEAKRKLREGGDQLKDQIRNTVKFTIKDTEKDAEKAGKDLGKKVVTGVKKVMEERPNVMKDEVDDYIDRAESETVKNDAASAGQSVANKVVEGIESENAEFFTAGANSANGFIDGIISKLDEAFSAGQELASSAKSGTKALLDINSPSRVMRELGMYGGKGFVLGVLDMVSDAGDAGTKLADDTKTTVVNAWKGISAVIKDDMLNVDPTIKPNVDLTNVQNAVADINRLFNEAIDTATKNAQIKIESSTQQLASSVKDLAKNSGSVTNNFSMVQNNTSPKALSATEIYRQTRNQFSQLQGVLNHDTSFSRHKSSR